MSILPRQSNSSVSSSSDNLRGNPNYLNHGLFQSSPQEEFREGFSSDNQITGSGSQFISSHSASGSVSAVPSSSGGSSKKVSDARTPNGRKNWNHQNNGTSSQAGGGGISSQFSSVHSAPRKHQTANGNHLLNFQYDPITRPKPRMTLPRKTQKIKPYNKDLFIQANYKFVVLDCGNDELELMDPDKMLHWDNVVCVRYSAPDPVQCPICLESPLCPQITSCGHIFCFPCILQYLLMGEEDRKGESWKRCPLCFMMISSKDLYTLNIESVKQHYVGENMQFTLLCRAKDSLIPSQKNQQNTDSVPCSGVALCDSFSKFTVASNVELSVRKAMTELDGWLARAESGLVEDLEKLPYVCAAMEQLDERRKCWNAMLTLHDMPNSRNPALPCSNGKACKYTNKTKSHVFSSIGSADAVYLEEASGHASLSPSASYEFEPKSTDKLNGKKLYEEDCSVQTTDVCETSEVGENTLSSSGYVKEKESYTFYQAIDGQHLILHPLNMKCLLHYYGSYDALPSTIGGEILQLESVTQSDAMRRRYRYLSHFSLTTTFKLCEIDLSKMLPLDAMLPFMDEIKKRENQRKRLAQKEHREKLKAEADALKAMPVPLNFGRQGTSMFSMDDFEALGSSPASSTSPPVVGERTKFSEVTRLGFAAGIDSPSVTADTSSIQTRNEIAVPTGQRSNVTLSFASIISTAKPTTEGVEAAKTDGLGKKGKKPSRVLLSTASGRRY
ncbi:hypothetical protein MKX01_025717 [Papaver californicum]|nr:hypothetical protein MKX01_025717 [Papaver californicum]